MSPQVFGVSGTAPVEGCSDILRLHDDGAGHDNELTMGNVYNAHVKALMAAAGESGSSSSSR